GKLSLHLAADGPECDRHPGANRSRVPRFRPRAAAEHTDQVAGGLARGIALRSRLTTARKGGTKGRHERARKSATKERSAALPGKFGIAPALRRVNESGNAFSGVAKRRQFLNCPENRPVWNWPKS